MVVLNPEILYEDSYIIAIDKPYGVVVNRSETQKLENTVQDWLLEKYYNCYNGYKDYNDYKEKEEEYDKIKEFYDRSGIVHRLDKHTSGVLLIAKDPSSFANLQKQFKDREIEKEYLAVVYGDITKEFKEKEFTINAPIGRNPRNRLRWAIVDNAREAETSFKIEGVFSKTPQIQYTVLKCFPKSGRTHQIRVHLSALGYPIVGDLLYAPKKKLKMENEWTGRMLLCAMSLKFTHPFTGEKLVLKSGIPEEFKCCLP